MTHTTARVLMRVKKSDRVSLPLASHDVQSGVWNTSPDLRGLLRPNSIIICKDHSALRFLVYLWFLKSSKVERVTFSHQAPLFSRKFSVRVREVDTLCTYKISLKPFPLRDIIISHYRATTIIIGNLMLRGKTLIHHVLSSAHSWVTVWYHKFQLFTVTLRTHQFWKPRIQTLMEGLCRGFHHPTGAPFSQHSLWIWDTVKVWNTESRVPWKTSLSIYPGWDKEISGISSKINGSASITQRSTRPSGMKPILDQTLHTECLRSVITSQKCCC